MRTLLHFFLFMMTINLIQLSVEAIPVQSRCDEDQRSLLLQFKETLSFDSSYSSKLIYWNSSTNCCSWAGVSCTDGLVTGLDISDEFSVGGIDNSSILFDLQHLQSLNLANNFVSNDSQIPSAIGRLTNLRYLNLSSTDYLGQIPIEISHLTKLVTLDLSGNSFKLENPNLSMLIQNLTELTELYLDDVNISSAHGAHWSQAISSSRPNLKVLSLRGCNISGPIHQSFAKLQSLSVLLLDGNDISAPVPGFFANFSSLTSLSLSSCNLYGTFPEEIFQITTLQKLDLSSNPELQGSLPEFLNNGSLQYLDLSSSKFSGFLPKSIGNLKMLSTLDLSGCSFTGSIPNSVANLTQLNFLAMYSNSFNSLFDSIHWENLVNLEYLFLDSNLLHGSIPLSLFSPPVLQYLSLSQNQFYGQLPEFANISSNVLRNIDLSGNHLEGPIPTSIFNLRELEELHLSSNHFSGFPFNGPQQPKNLSFLDLSNNSLLIDYNGSSPTSSSFLQISGLDLSSNKFPDFLRNQFRLEYLDLSDNQIQGEIPNWIWKLNSLVNLNLSYNSLATLQGPLLNLTSNVHVLDLRSNNLQGQIPLFLSSATYLDYSRNNFSSSIPADIGNFLHSTAIFSLSSNNLHGIIPPSICNVSTDVLDLSNNSLSGMIPECLTRLSVLNLRRNNLTGPIPDKFVESCSLQTLDLSRNQIQGQFPKSLVNCTELKVVNLGNNQITDTFPCLLKNISTLRVLVLRSNKFYGRIGCPKANGTWPMLQIIDLAYNNLSGEIPGTSMTTWKQMMVNKDDSPVSLGFSYNPGLPGGGRSPIDIDYDDAVTITSKGSERDLVKILTFFTLIDFSCNEFNGSIPEEMGEFKSLHVLNLSCNAFTGEIPSSFGNMRVLESVDLSKNNLSGQIPPQLADLSFLSFLNLSNNQLVGRIPTSTQFSTFPNASFAGNKGLWGPPLTADDKPGLPVPPAASNESRRSSGHEINWDLISVEIGFVFGFGVAIGSLAFYKRWRNWYYKATLNIIFKMFPQLHQRLGNRGRHVHINQRGRR